MVCLAVGPVRQESNVPGDRRHEVRGSLLVQTGVLEQRGDSNEGSKIDNNLEIINRYMDVKATNQTWIVNGNILIKPIFSYKNPVMFIGQDIVPTKIDDFILENDITSLVLIGNELAPMVSQFKERMEYLF